MNIYIYISWDGSKPINYAHVPTVTRLYPMSPISESPSCCKNLPKILCVSMDCFANLSLRLSSSSFPVLSEPGAHFRKYSWGQPAIYTKAGNSWKAESWTDVISD